MHEEDFYEENNTIYVDLKTSNIELPSLKAKLLPFEDYEIVMEVGWDMTHHVDITEVSNEHRELETTKEEQEYLIELYENEIQEELSNL